MLRHRMSALPSPSRSAMPAIAQSLVTVPSEPPEPPTPQSLGDRPEQASVIEGVPFNPPHKSFPGGVVPPQDVSLAIPIEAPDPSSPPVAGARAERPPANNGGSVQEPCINF